MPKEGFNISFSTHDGRKFRNINIQGRKLTIFRITAGLTLFVLLAMATLTVMFFVYSAENKELTNENRAIGDSLATMIELETRMELLSEQLQEIIEAKVIIENMTQIIELQDE